MRRVRDHVHLSYINLWFRPVFILDKFTYKVPYLCMYVYFFMVYPTYVLNYTSSLKNNFVDFKIYKLGLELWRFELASKLTVIEMYLYVRTGKQ